MLSTCVGNANRCAIMKKRLKDGQLKPGFISPQRPRGWRRPDRRNFLSMVIGGPIVEVEAITKATRQAHSYGGPEETHTAVMSDRPATCMSYALTGQLGVNFVCAAEDSAQRGPDRAIMPTTGLARTMRRRRGVPDERQLCAGPGGLCQAPHHRVGITERRSDKAPFTIFARTAPVEM